METLYTAEAVVEGGRQEHGRTSDGRLDVAADLMTRCRDPHGTFDPGDGHRLTEARSAMLGEQVKGNSYIFLLLAFPNAAAKRCTRSKRRQALGGGGGGGGGGGAAHGLRAGVVDVG
jgi:hypothetical protein